MSPELHLDLDLDVIDVSVEFSVHKNPYYNCCQMSFSLSQYTKIDVGWASGGAYSAPLQASYLVLRGPRGRFEAEGNGGEGREGLGGKRGREGKGGWGRREKGEVGGIAPWSLGDRRPCQ